MAKNKWNIDYENDLHINDSLDGLAVHPLLSRIKIDEDRLTQKLIKRGEARKNKYGSGGPWNSSIDPYGFGVEWQVGVRHGLRMAKGLTLNQELFLLYLENQWLIEEEARRDYGMQSDPVAEIILNRLGEDEYIALLESGEVTATAKDLAEAKERNRHNLEKEYKPESYLELKAKAEEACEAYRG